MNGPELCCENDNSVWVFCIRSVQRKLDSPESMARMAVLREKMCRVGVPGKRRLQR